MLILYSETSFFNSARSMQLEKGKKIALWSNDFYANF